MGAMAAVPVDIGQDFADPTQGADGQPLDDCSACQVGQQEVQSVINELQRVCNLCAAKKTVQQSGCSCSCDGQPLQPTEPPPTTPPPTAPGQPQFYNPNPLPIPSPGPGPRGAGGGQGCLGPGCAGQPAPQPLPGPSPIQPSPQPIPGPGPIPIQPAPQPLPQPIPIQGIHIPSLKNFQPRQLTLQGALPGGAFQGFNVGGGFTLGGLQIGGPGL